MIELIIFALAVGILFSLWRIITIEDMLEELVDELKELKDSIK